MKRYDVDPKDLVVNNRDSRPSSFAEPLIEVCSVTITPFEPYESCLIHGEIYVVDSRGEKIYIYNRGRGDPETITSGGPGSLLLTGPETGVIKMDGSVNMVIKLKVQGLGLERNKGRTNDHFFQENFHLTNEFERRAHITGGAARSRSNRVSNYNVMKGQGLPPTQGRNVWFAKGCINMDTTAELCCDENKCLTLKGDLGDVCVKYISMPCARIAEVTVVITKEGGDSDAEYGDDGNSRFGRPDAYVSGNITAHYGKNYGQTWSDSAFDNPSLILYNKIGRKRDRLYYGFPIKLCRSLVCVPSYSSLSVTLGNIAMKERNAKENIVFSGVFEFEVVGGGTYSERLSVGDVRVTVRVSWFTSDKPDIYLRKGKSFKGPQSLSRLQPASASSICMSVSPIEDIPDFERIQILSFSVVLGEKEEVDIFGTVAVRHSMGSCYIFKKDEKSPENLSRGKALSLEGLTSYSLDNFCMKVKVKDLKGHVDIENFFGMYYRQYEHPGQWFNRPLCYVLSGRQSFAAVHFIVFKSAVKATVKIRVIAKDSTSTSTASWPFVYGSVVAQYSNYQYSTNYQRKYWRIVLFEEENARCLSKEGDISLSRNVISVPTDSSLILDIDLYASSGLAGSSSSDGCVDHFLRKAEIRIGDDESQKIVGQNFDVVVSTQWESGLE